MWFSYIWDEWIATGYRVYSSSSLLALLHYFIEICGHIDSRNWERYIPECSRQQALEWGLSAGSRFNLGLLFLWGIPNVCFFCSSSHVWFSSEACVVSLPLSLYSWHEYPEGLPWSRKFQEGEGHLLCVTMAKWLTKCHLTSHAVSFKEKPSCQQSFALKSIFTSWFTRIQQEKE